jgi:hypothetical protein
LFGLLQVGHYVTLIGISSDDGALSLITSSKIGDTLFPEGSLNVPGGAYVIIRQLPERSGEFEYQ